MTVQKPDKFRNQKLPTTLWAIINPKGRLLIDTVRRKRWRAIYQVTHSDTRFPYSWKNVYYNRGYRAIKVIITPAAGEGKMTPQPQIRNVWEPKIPIEFRIRTKPTGVNDGSVLLWIDTKREDGKWEDYLNNFPLQHVDPPVVEELKKRLCCSTPSADKVLDELVRWREMQERGRLKKNMYVAWELETGKIKELKGLSGEATVGKIIGWIDELKSSHNLGIKPMWKVIDDACAISCQDERKRVLDELKLRFEKEQEKAIDQSRGDFKCTESHGMAIGYREAIELIEAELRQQEKVK
jgi:hypothetical protein